MSKEPAFLFYASDWLGSNNRAQMTLAEQGAYINLLARQWADPTCSLPPNDEALATLSEAGKDWGKGGYMLVKECFPPHPDLKDRLANTKLLDLWAERQEWIKKSRKGGRRSALKRWGHKGLGKDKGGYKMVVTKGVTKPQPNGNPPSPSPSPSLTPVSPLEGTENKEGTEPKKRKKRKKPNEGYSADFEQFWLAYPKKGRVAKGDVWREWQKAIKRGPSPTIQTAVIISKLREYAESPRVQAGTYVKHATTWLHNDCWEDDPAAWQDSGEESYGPNNAHEFVDEPMKEYK